MRIFIMTDMEGISGVCRREHVMQGASLYEAGRRYLTAEINACVEGCLDAGASEIVVRDGHGGHGSNLLWDQAHPSAEYVLGDAGPRRFGAPIEDFDAIILLGYHAMGGTPGAILEHTMSSAHWQNFWLNGRLCGEIAVDAAVAGEHGVPTILVTGDDKACAEALDFLPGVTVAVVKEGNCCYGGRMLSADAAHALVRQRTAEAVARIDSTTPFAVETPVTARLEKVSRSSLPDPEAKPYMRIVGPRTYEVTADSVEQALARL